MLPDRKLGLALGLLSFVILSYQVTQVRVFAYALNPLLVYSAISITMLGFGGASTALALSPRLRALPLRPALAASCIAVAISGLIANILFAATSASMTPQSDVLGAVTLRQFGVIALCTLPYVFGGLVVALMLSRRVEGVGRLYFFNLVGSGIGCFAVSFLLNPLGAERLILALLATAALVGALLAGGAAPRLRMGGYLVSIAFVASMPWAETLLPLEPDSTDQHAVIADAYRRAGRAEPVRDYASWDPVARVEIHSWPGEYALLPHPVPFKFLTQDGGAGTLLVGFDVDPLRGDNMFRGGATGLPFHLRPGSDVLIIGVGGTGDVKAAQHFGAKHITAVEINASTVHAMTHTFGDFLGHPLTQPNVDVVVGDGRSYVRRTDKRFDVISIPGVDTFTLQSSGSFVFAEEYLYTREAFGDYLRALRPDGLLSILRFAHEPIRLTLLGSRALADLGVERPDKHVVVLDKGTLKLTLIKRSPWTPAELERLDRIVEESPRRLSGLSLFVMDTFFKPGALEYLYAPHKPNAHPLYGAIMKKVGEGTFPAITLPTDDRPYYFSAEWVKFFRGVPTAKPVQDMLGGYARFMGIVIALSLLAIALPVLVMRRGGHGVRRTFGTVVYFFALGFCFMFLEIGLIQKTTIVVEHPAYSVAVVLAGLLISSGIGSLSSERLGWTVGKNVAVAAVAIAVIGTTYAFTLDGIFHAMLGLPFVARMLGVALVIAPLGIAMGMLFPSGLRALGKDAGGLVPWAIAANGLASVIGSVLSLPFAVMFGFTALLLGGVALYTLGCLAFPLLAPPSDGPPIDRQPATS
jgi:Spermine/spermidine synthase domain